MEQAVSKEEIRQLVLEARREGKRVALVPTMGALHEGHLSLVRAAQARADLVVVSIFVNPTQFGPSEDFEAYPRDLARDLALLSAEGVDAAFTPGTEAMYAPDAQVTVDPGPLGDVWEGASRPGHFRGVCTIVAKLFALVAPDLAFFGEKDYQQLVIVKRMVADLDFPVKVVGCPIVREYDGLAMSSRNAYLSAEERAAATVLYRALREAETLVCGGETSVEYVEQAMRDTVEAEPLASLDYAALIDPHTLVRAAGAGGARAIIAARVGATRLIDNMAMPSA
ncbi:pantoate--beta-alanine ligase [Coriobacteriia bacterium Es71-Z0120]|uniref:pantoate--beta-alanine ligase n=1 Tax=Parvivirga hydrogeniphila TaxID=2939460 RepID=UPI002260BC17|nr:pantoate--beta-alanine ligase [Parvivirga hydrogeniphila]MCL4079405.1 pantoate--beta-alanine ligase [Parvivirga hydrogeniphila]